MTCQVPDREQADTFYNEGLRLARDPALKGHPRVTWYNIGRQQVTLLLSTQSKWHSFLFKTSACFMSQYPQCICTELIQLWVSIQWADASQANSCCALQAWLKVCSISLSVQWLLDPMAHAYQLSYQLMSGKEHRKKKETKSLCHEVS